MTKDLDFSDAPLVQADPDAWALLRELVQSLAKAQTRAEDLKHEAEENKEVLAELRDKRVPEHCRTMGYGGGKVDGHELALKADVVGKLPTDPVDRAKAIQWLEEHGFGPKVKRSITILLGKDQAPLAARIIRGIEKLEIPGVVIMEEVTVEPQSLLAIGRKKFEDGEITVDELRTLGLIPITRARLK